MEQSKDVQASLKAQDKTKSLKFVVWSVMRKQNPFDDNRQKTVVGKRRR